MVFMAISKETTSASGVVCTTWLCTKFPAASGMKEFGPTSARKLPEVDRNVSVSPARWALAYSLSLISAGESPLYPMRADATVQLM
jgi:hypothetical protein